MLGGSLGRQCPCSCLMEEAEGCLCSGCCLVCALRCFFALVVLSFIF